MVTSLIFGLATLIIFGGIAVYTIKDVCQSYQFTKREYERDTGKKWGDRGD